MSFSRCSDLEKHHIPRFLGKTGLDVACVVDEHVDRACFQDLRDNRVDVCRSSCDVETEGFGARFLERG